MGGKRRHNPASFAAFAWAFLFVAALCVFIAPIASAAPAEPNDPPPADASAHDEPAESSEADGPENPLSEAGELERKTLNALLGGMNWSRRAIALIRLLRYDCDESLRLALDSLDDPAWQVRTYAAMVVAWKTPPGEPLDSTWLEEEQNPQVVRTALRCGFSMEPDRIARGVRILSRARRVEDQLLAAELAAASGDPELEEAAREAIKTVILRMDRTDSGIVAHRLAALTGQPPMRRHYQWQQWYRKNSGTYTVHPARMFEHEPGPDGATARPAPPRIAELQPQTFAALEDYIEQLGDRSVDLAICIDCTASMYGELAAAQGGIDDLVAFVGDVVQELRIGIVAYRDRRDRFETLVFPLTPDLAQARSALWELEADGGGDTPEAVYEALDRAYRELAWNEAHNRVVVIVGDAPPHVGKGALCIDLATRAAEVGFITHAIEAEGEPVKHFEEISLAGGGQCIPLDDDDALVAEIAGLSLGGRFLDEFREFFRMYRQLCR